MRARVLAVLIAVLATPLLPQCNFTPVLSDPFRSSILDLAIDGNDLWAATGYGLALYDRSVDPPRLSGLIAIPGVTRDVPVANGLAYAASGNSIAVVRKNGRSLQLIRTIDTGSQVNDIVVTPIALFAATNNGIIQYALTDATNPSAPAQVTQTAATSLALVGSTLYAAEGDATVEVFSISPFVQRTGSITAPANVTSVHANNGKLFVSTAVQTYVFVSGNNVGSVPFTMTSVAPLTGDVVFAGSNDRTLRAIDFTAAGSPIDMFRTDLPPIGGTINRVTSIAVAGSRVYAGAGDIGIADFDVTAFTAPFAMRHVAFPGVSSVFSLGDNFYLGLTTGVTEFSQGLLHKRSWDGSRADVVQDGAPGFLLTSSAQTVSLWALNTVSNAVGTATFRAPIVDAVLIGTTTYAVLNDRTLWSVDFSQSAMPAAQQVATNGLQPVSIARSGNAMAIADTRSDGTTSIALIGGSTVSVPGLATTPITLSGSIAAVQTFRGITLVDLSSGSTSVLPQSNDAIARQIFMSGTTLLELTDSTLRVWNTTTGTKTSEVTLPSTPIAVHMADGATTADVVTSSGIGTIALDRLSGMPAAIATPNGNAFYKKVIASQNRIALVDARGVDLFTNAMEYAGSIRASGIVDVAVSDSAIYTLSGNLIVSAYTPFGTPAATATINEGSDAQALSIATVNGAVWVSIVRGCTSGACEKKTIVFDNKLSQTIPMPGAIVDVVTSGSRAYALTDFPSEVRVINVADPTHPSIVASAAATGMSLAYSNGTIYILGSGLAAYSESSLMKIADILSGSANPDEHIRIEGGCAMVTGLQAGPQLFALPQFTAASSFATPATARSVASQPGAFYVLTDNSLEIWSTAPLPKPPRKHPAR
jgi:hypothetical protein